MARKVKIPKAIAGIGVPKGVRRARVIKSVLNNPVGRAVLADALVAAAGAAAKALVQHRPSGAQVAAAGERVLDAGGHAATATADTTRSAAGTLGGVVSEVASYVLSDTSAKKRKKAKKREYLAAKDKGKGKRARRK